MSSSSDFAGDGRASGPLAAWGRFAVRHHRLVLAGWAAVILAFAIATWAAGGRFATELDMPGTESQAARDLLTARFPQQSGDPAQLVIFDPAGLAAPEAQARVEALLDNFRGLPEVVAVTSPYAAGGRAVSGDGMIAYATIQYSVPRMEVRQSSVEALLDTVDRLNDTLGGASRLEVGGPVVESGEVAPPGRAELIGLTVAAVILLVAFGSVVASGLPIVTAVVGLGTGLAAIALAARALPMTTFTPAFAGMIGIGVGIDYALLIVTRYREELARGQAVAEAVATALDTAGRAVTFAGAVVVVALLGLFVTGIRLQTGLGVAGAAVVASNVVVAITLLPALLAIAGTRIDRWRVRGRRAASTPALSLAYRLARRIQRHPARYALGALVLLLVLASPVLSMRLGSSDAASQPEQFHSRRAYDLLARGFGPGFNGPLVVAVDLPAGGDDAALARLGDALRETDDVVFAAPPLLSPAGDAAVITVIPLGSPQDASTSALTKRLREEVIPAALAGSGTRAYVGGVTATFEDIGAKIAESMPLFFALVIGASVVLLAVVFRSLAVPLKAAAMNMLSIGAAYGVVVAIFQWGWLGDLVGAGRPGPVESFLPVMLFAILFGLSMDYEVFLLSRIREEWASGIGNSDAVARGLGQTARVITAAAAIMVSVFLSFALSEGRVVKEFGIGLGTAILIDATVVRIVLVPAVMELLGEANWWLPRWLDRALPRIQIEGSRSVAARAATPVGSPRDAF